MKVMKWMVSGLKGVTSGRTYLIKKFLFELYLIQYLDCELEPRNTKRSGK
jgi:hypothetical protein